ncbi:unnamed protein product [Rotaria sp. Silwood1]|nr:unnamed protein product [Rotaria sp. Silwood1]CAF1257583.1 unnamed protein product [Rotaria sp. Silwood1]CAF3500687.1 unnamed protein product [Rotaria sp. Silwood1]CAF3509571.1 unnamed protein product [Rotaria sp. Silwood1]CAF3522933.1 unnamed protein product [Rotaria sp. Silwood1]
MGGSGSRRKSPPTPFPPQGQPYGPSPYSSPPYPGMGNPQSLNQKQQQQLQAAYQTIRNLQGGMPPMQQGAGPPIMNLSNASPTLQRAFQQSLSPNPSPFSSGNYRDTDYASLANIAGLSPVDIAILHKEYMNLTRLGRNKLDRVVFRQLLRDILIDANNENIDRAIENIFLCIDRNRDGFIDFSEFVGAFRDILRTDSNDPQGHSSPCSLPDMINEQLRACAYNSPLFCQPATVCQQVQPPTAQVIPISSASVQQPMVCSSSAAPLVYSFDSNQSPCFATAQGPSIIGQPTTLQCLPLPM